MLVLDFIITYNGAFFTVKNNKLITISSDGEPVKFSALHKDTSLVINPESPTHHTPINSCAEVSSRLASSQV